MSDILSRLTNFFLFSKLKTFIRTRQLTNLDRVLSITNAQKMPELARLQIGSAKRMNASILFFDLAKFTTTTSEIPKEYTLYMLNMIIPTVTEIIKICRGEVEKNTGDGLMAIFGAYRQTGALVAKDAIEAALLIKHFMINYIQPAFYNLGLPELDFRIGMDMGEILIARLGTTNNTFLTAIGNAANRASKLQTLAKLNGICIGETIIHNLHHDLHRYCYPGQDPSWNWTLQNSEIPYRYSHFEYNLIEPSAPSTVTR